MSRTMLLKYAETDALYFSWRWRDALEDVQAARLGADMLARVDAILTQTLPEAIVTEQGVRETTEQALTRSLTSSWFATPAHTRELGGALGDSLIPADLADALRTETLRAEARAQGRPRLRIQTSPRTARVPWALLRIGPERTPLLDLCDLEFAPPAPIAARTAAKIQDPTDAIVAVIDPRVPGASATSELGSVLGRPHADDSLAALLRHGDRLRPRIESYLELPRRRDIDRPWLRRELEGAARLLYVGHATGAEQADAGVGSALHLAGEGPHEPLTAAELVRDGWGFPQRCALIACGSGTDLRDAEPMGLTLAAIACGARVVTSTAWALPTDAAIALVGGTQMALSEAASHPLRDLVLAVDAAQDSPDPVAALCAWQRERLTAWDQSGSLAETPAVWAAAMTFRAD